MHHRLTPSEISTALAELPHWRLVDDRLQRRFAFDDFVAAFAFMTRVAFVAERLGHHPDWTNVYNRVEVSLWTHDAGGITTKDLELAGAMEQAARAP